MATQITADANLVTATASIANSYEAPTATYRWLATADGGSIQQITQLRGLRTTTVPSSATL